MGGSVGGPALGDRETYVAARERVETRLGLAAHWLVYLVVNTALLVAAGELAGSLWRLAGWGLGLVLHTGYVLVDVDGVRDRLVRRELDRSAGAPH